MTRIAMGIEYLGTNYHGWQKQGNTGKTLQAALEKAISKVADETIHTTCAGRTDAGVHATCQVVHFDTEVLRPDSAWLRGTNTKLPPEMRVVWTKRVEDDFHARFSAIRRTYDYYIDNRSIYSPFIKHKVNWRGPPLDVALMQKAANHLVGTHDFSAYRAANCQAHNPIRTLTTCYIREEGGLLRLTVTANAFLQHMIRNIVGVLIEVGESKKPPDWARDILEGRDRARSAPTASPCGLYLTHIEYPEQYKIPTNRGFILST